MIPVDLNDSFSREGILGFVSFKFCTTVSKMDGIGPIDREFQPDYFIGELIS